MILAYKQAQQCQTQLCEVTVTNCCIETSMLAQLHRTICVSNFGTAIWDISGFFFPAKGLKKNTLEASGQKKTSRTDRNKRTLTNVSPQLANGAQISWPDFFHRINWPGGVQEEVHKANWQS